MKNKIKSAGIATLLSIVLMAGFIGCSHTQAIRNDTGSTVVEVYYRDTGTTNWGNTKNVRARRNSSGELILTFDGQYIYERFPMNNGTQINYFSDPSWSKTPKGISNKDIRIVDNNGIVYIKLNVPISFKTTGHFGNVINDPGPIVFTVQDRLPMLTMRNQTGFPIRITAPVTQVADNGANVYWQLQDLNQSQNIPVKHSINDYTFTQNVNLDADVTLTLTERPPVITVVNNTGYPINVSSPFSQAIANGSRSVYPKQSRDTNPLHTIAYRIGNAQYTEQVSINNDDVTLTLTRRPPVVTIVNNTGNTVNLVFLRNPGANWTGQNILNLQLRADGTVDTAQAGVAAGERRGSITNRESFRFWFGNVEIRPDRYDIRIDDVQGNSYVKSNVQITSDITLTFTQSDKR